MYSLKVINRMCFETRIEIATSFYSAGSDSVLQDHLLYLKACTKYFQTSDCDGFLYE